MSDQINAQIKNEIREFIAEVTELTPEEIGADANIFVDLGADSMSALELMVMLEKKYKIKIKAEELKEIATLNQIMRLVNQHLNK